MTVVQYHGDGIKVGPGAHDLSIRGGSIRCYAHDPGKHQDGIQAMGGQRVTFTGLNDQCTSANNSALFISVGHAREPRPTLSAIVAIRGGGSRCGRGLAPIRNPGSRVCPGKFGSVRVSPGIALSPIDIGTTVLSSACSGGTGTPPPATDPPPHDDDCVDHHHGRGRAARKGEHTRHKRSKAAARREPDHGPDVRGTLPGTLGSTTREVT
jgi:hypothetical protein